MTEGVIVEWLFQKFSTYSSTKKNIVKRDSSYKYTNIHKRAGIGSERLLVLFKLSLVLTLP
jgi:hypothetical protein